jgi:hypothetical protein
MPDGGEIDAGQVVSDRAVRVDTDGLSAIRADRVEHLEQRRDVLGFEHATVPGWNSVAEFVARDGVGPMAEAHTSRSFGSASTTASTLSACGSRRASAVACATASSCRLRCRRCSNRSAQPAAVPTSCSTRVRSSSAQVRPAIHEFPKLLALLVSEATRDEFDITPEPERGEFQREPFRPSGTHG